MEVHGEVQQVEQAQSQYSRMFRDTSSISNIMLKRLGTKRKRKYGWHVRHGLHR